MYQQRGDDHGDRTKRVGENVQEYTMHIFIMAVVVAVVVASVDVGVVEGHDAHEVDEESGCADEQ